MGSGQRLDSDNAPSTQRRTPPNVPSSLRAHGVLNAERADTGRYPVDDDNLQREPPPPEEPSVMSPVVVKSTQDGSLLESMGKIVVLPVPSEPAASASEGEDVKLHYPPTEDEVYTGHDTSDASFDVPLLPDGEVSSNFCLLLRY